MASYIITYDLKKPGRNYGALYERIKEYGTWAHITESSWAVVSSKGAADIRDRLTEVIDSNDELFVAAVSTPAAWFNLGEKMTDWLKKNLD